MVALLRVLGYFNSRLFPLCFDWATYVANYLISWVMWCRNMLAGVTYTHTTIGR